MVQVTTRVRVDAFWSKTLAVEVEDHPLDYGDFEGTIPKGQYGGGTVMLWDRGYWEPEGNLSAEAAFKKGDLKVRFDGKKLKGSWALVRLRPLLQLVA